MESSSYSVQTSVNFARLSLPPAEEIPQEETDSPIPFSSGSVGRTVSRFTISNFRTGAPIIANPNETIRPAQPAELVFSETTNTNNQPRPINRIAAIVSPIVTAPSPSANKQKTNDQKTPDHPLLNQQLPQSAPLNPAILQFIEHFEPIASTLTVTKSVLNSSVSEIAQFFQSANLGQWLADWIQILTH